MHPHLYGREGMSDSGKVVAIKERSDGNASVGDMWLETAIFSTNTPVGEIIEWASSKGKGKLIITTPMVDGAI